MEEYLAAVHGLAARSSIPMVIMSPLHYPPQAAADGGEISEVRIGAGAHSDY
jgi:hypothetical protein